MACGLDNPGSVPSKVETFNYHIQSCSGIYTVSILKILKCLLLGIR
jgi:hypothetical protein